MAYSFLFLVNNFPPTVDGVGDYTFQLSKALLKGKNKIAVITRKNPLIMEYGEVPGITVLPIVENWKSPLEWFRVLKVVISINPDFTILQYVPYAFHRKGIPVGVLFLMVILRFFAPGKLLVFFHEVRIKMNPKRIKNILLGVPMWLISGGIHRLSHHSMTSNEFYRRLLKQYAKDAKVIPVGSNIHVDLNSQLSKIIGDKIGEGDFVLGMFGFGVRGWQYILPVMAKLKMHIPNIKLLLLGALPKKLVKKIDESIILYDLEKQFILPGYLSPEIMPCYLNLIDVFLTLDPVDSLDQWNGTGTKSGTLAAAMSYGKAIIGIDGEITDGILRQDNMLLLKELSEYSLFHAVLSLYSNDELRRRLGQNAKNTAIKEFTWERIAFYVVLAIKDFEFSKKG